MEEKLRIHKYLSQAWICSRRKAEEYIKEWLISVNWKTAEIWQVIDPWVDKVKLLDKAVKKQNEYVYFKLNKPRWIVTTCANIWEKTILDIIDIDKRVFPIWRLDKETDWLILLTNDWRLANFLMHPRYNHNKEYIVETFWPIWDNALQKMRDWLFILWSYTKKAVVERISSWKFAITISEWRNRQIRRMVEKVWCTVKKLRRIRIENIELWKLKEWQYKALTNTELNELFKRLEIPRW